MYVVSIVLIAWLMVVKSVANVESATDVHDTDDKLANDESLQDKANLTSSTTPVVEETANPGATDSATDNAEQTNKNSTPPDGNFEQDNADKAQAEQQTKKVAQVGPFVDLLGPILLKLRQVDEKNMAIHAIPTNDALSGKRVIGLYFSADWCGPCRKFTPELVAFYNKMNERFGRKDEFEIVWVSRCRDMNSFQQYFTHMNWLAIPQEVAQGSVGKKLSEMYKVKGIPTLVLLDEVGQVITTDARNKLPRDKAGLGFPWRHPIANLYVTILPRSLRLMIKSHLSALKEKILLRLQTLLAVKPFVANR